MGNNMVRHENGMAVNMVVSRQAQEVQGAIFMAKQFPRDPMEASLRINKACGREGLAKVSTYTYPRGGQKVSGPSIRLAEEIARNWGNIDYGVIELTSSEGVSELMAYAWDLETNVRRSMIFSVKQERDTKQGKIALTDNRDIYENMANMGARRVRACILGVIPGDVVEEALDVCEKTLKNGAMKSIDDSIKNMLQNFENRFRITRQQLETYIGYPTANFNVDDVETLRGIYNSLKEGNSKCEDYFTFAIPQDALADLKKDDDHAEANG